MINYEPIGIIHSPFKKPLGAPIQATAAKNTSGSVEVFKEYAAGLSDIDGFSHIILLYHFSLAAASLSLTVKPFMDSRLHGVFATRAPKRPNPIGISIVKLTGIEKNILQIQNIDVLDGTPLLDIKPYVPKFDVVPADRIGWLNDNIQKLPESKDDGRFTVLK